MNIVPERKTVHRVLLYLLTGLCAGFVNGLAGTGAGVVFLLTFGLFGGGITKTLFSLSMACVVPLSAVSLITYSPPTRETLSMLPWLFIAAVSGGLCGGWIQRKIQVKILKWMFAVLVIWAGLRMLF